jgi:hypothetical protein
VNRTEFIVATAAILFVAFALGWFTCWLVGRFARVGQSDIGEVDRLASQLHEAEEQRDEAVAYYQAREREAEARAAETRAELAAAMEGLREARAEAEGLRGYIERANAQR